jgi:heme a synthase
MYTHVNYICYLCDSRINHSIDIDQFKRIFYMEWGHRVLGRIIGLAFVVPLGYFALRKRIPRSLAKNLFGMALLIGAQGALGWYMVKSGLEDSLMETPGAVPRVSQYRLAAHLGTAFVLYAGMFYTAIATFMDWRYATAGKWAGLVGDGSQVTRTLNNPLVKRFLKYSKALTAFVFVTALSGQWVRSSTPCATLTTLPGAFVAGLDAGLVYNEFPLMGGRIAPPADELFSPAYAKSEDKSDVWWRNLFENPTTVQFDHRCLVRLLVPLVCS